MKKSLAAIICAAMLVSSAAGCSSPSSSSQGGTGSSQAGSTAASTSAGSAADPASPGGDSNLTAPGELPIVKEKVTLNVTTQDKAYIGPLEDTDFFKWFEEQTNVHLNIDEIPPDAYKEKLNLMLVSGELPDILVGGSIAQDQEVLYGTQGIFLPLNDLIDTYGVETKKVFEENPGSREFVTTPDGNIYGLPLINDCYHCKYPQRAWINQNWLDKLGFSMPVTTEEFETVMQAFKDQDPNGNGKADEIPIMGDPKSWCADVFPFLACAFIYQNSDTNVYLDSNNQITFTADKPEYKDAIVWIKGLVEKGLLDPTSFTQDIEQYKQVARDQEGARIGVGVSANIQGIFGSDLDTPDMRQREYVALPPLQGPNGLRVTPKMYNQAVAPGYFVITNKCTMPEVAFRLADYWYSEEATMASWLGMEGVGYNKAQDGQTGIDGKMPAIWERIIVENEPVEQLRTVTNVFGNNSERLRLSQVTDYSNPDTEWMLEQRLYNETKKAYEPYVKPEMTVPSFYWLPDEASEYATLSTQIKDYAKENRTLFILGNRDIEKEWDAYLAEYEKLSLPRMLELMQTAYDRQYS